MFSILALVLSLFGAAPAAAQGCGQQNPNCIVPTAPVGTSNNQAASTEFVQNQIGATVADVPHGGTGQTTLTNHGVLVGQGTSPVVTVGPCSLGQVIGGNGASSDPSCQAGGAVPIATMAALRALSPGQYNAVYLTGYFSQSDGGEGLFVWNAGSSATDDAGVVIQPHAGGTGRWIRVTNSTRPNVVWWGAKCDASTNDSTAFNASIAWAAGINGAHIWLPSTICDLGSTVTINSPSIIFEGTSGGQSLHDVGAQPTSSGLIWSGSVGGTMMRIAAPTGGSSQVLVGNGLNNIQFLCNGAANAGVGLRLESVRLSNFSNLFFRECSTAGLDSSVVSTAIGEAQGTSENIFSNISTRNLTNTGIGIRLDGVVARNFDTCCNVFYNTFMTMQNGVGIQLNYADDNTFINTLIVHGAGGTADAIQFAGPDASHYAQRNVFYSLTISGKDASGGNIHAFSPSNGNAIYFYDSFNAGPIPIVDAGAQLTWQYERTPTVDSDGTLNLGVAGVRSGNLKVSGSTSGTISFLPQAAAGTYNFNWPTTAGSSSQCLASGGGGATATSWLPCALTNVANTFTIGQSFSVTDTSTIATFTSTDPGAANAPVTDWVRNSASPANADGLGMFRFIGNNSTPTLIAYSTWVGTIKTVTAGSEAAQFRLLNYVGGVQTTVLDIQAGVQFGAPTGGDPGTGNASAAGWFACAAPVTKAGTSGTVGASECSTIFNPSGAFTVTLPSAAGGNTGRILYLKNIAAQTVSSASSNVVPLAGGAAGTAILTATAGKYAQLQSDGTNWIIMQGN